MNPKSFVTQIRASLIEASLDEYKNLFETTAPGSATDPYWIRALDLYSELSDNQKAVFFEVIRNVMVDTVSYFAGVLDGTSPILAEPDDLILTMESSPDKINGDLQDLFLELEELEELEDLEGLEEWRNG